LSTIFQCHFCIFIYPYLTYCNIIWASTYATRLKPILRTQKQLVRIKNFTNYTEKSRPLFMSLKTLDTYELNKYLMAMFKYSCHHDKNYQLSSISFFKLMKLHSYNTRSASKVHIEFRKTNYGKFSVQFKGGVTWNSLPTDIIKVNLFNMFNSKLKEYVQSHHV